MTAGETVGPRPAGAGPSCPEHGPAVESQHRFCEVCGRDLVTGEPAGSATAPEPSAGLGAGGAGTRGSGGPARWVSSRAAGESCAGCGTREPGDRPHCEHCGRRRAAGRDRAECDLGTVAAVTDRARRRRNEDAFAIGGLPGTTLGVVCDGVSTSPRADDAAHAAVEAAMVGLLSVLGAGGAPRAATAWAARAAATAVRALGAGTDGDSPPSCTYVSAVVTAESVTVGWIGDSRAYWIGPDPADAMRLTVDDSVVGRLTAGLPIPSGAEAAPDSRALVRWLGADAEDTEAQIAVLRPDTPGRLVLCTDGLSHYLPEPAAFAEAVAGRAGPPVVLARELTRLAIDSGGHDNVAVVVIPFPPVGPTGDPAGIADNPRRPVEVTRARADIPRGAAS